uniref:WPP domain-interacting tail-anchored protein 1 n=1 Tax=Rhizophora mucronata TaxID=61149 RepID=A0A2P2IRT8_RHIMU
MENMIDGLNARLSKAENRAENAEANCKLLGEINMELNKELGHLKGISEKVDLLEKKLRESDINLQHAVASSEASQEKQSMLNSTIKDMENLIENLKLKVSKAESRADSAEEKCLILSESNAELDGELSFLRGRLERVEASLNQAEESKMATARDIGFRTKIITDLVMQLAIERERLHKQISSLALENKTLVVRLRQPKKDASGFADYHSNGNEKGPSFPESEVTHVSATGSEFERRHKDAPAGKTKEAAAATVSNIDCVRRIDAGNLNFKHVFTALLVALFSAALYMFLSREQPF